MVTEAGRPPDSSPGAWVERLLSHSLLQLSRDAWPPGACVVGGAVRDAWLGLAPEDLDLTVPPDRFESFVAELASRFGGQVVRLSERRIPLHRIVTRAGIVDVAPWSAPTLEAELARRDLTIHAVAVELTSGRVLDPFGGLKDLARRRLRPPRESAFSDDPLRVLRLARFEIQLAGFRISPSTRALARKQVLKLDQVAGERIREELRRLASLERFAAASRALVRLDVYPSVWNPRPANSASERLLASSRRLERLIAALPQPAGLDRFALEQALRFGASAPVAQDEQALARDWFDRRRLSRDELDRMLRWLSQRRDPFPRSRADWGERLFRLGPTWREGLLLAAALDLQRPPAVWLRALATASRIVEAEGPEVLSPRPHLPAEEIAALLGIQPGPELGATVRELQLLRARGQVKSPSAARRYLQQRLRS